MVCCIKYVRHIVPHITHISIDGLLFVTNKQYNSNRAVNVATGEYTLQSGPPFRVLYEYT